MKIVHAGAAPIPAPVATSNNTEARARAMAAFMGDSSTSKAAETPVPNPTQIAPEEMSAIVSPSIPEPNLDASAVSEDTSQPIEVTQKVATPEQDDRAAKQFALLARREKALRAKAQQQEQALKAREQALAEREAKLTQQPQIDQSKYISIDRFKADPLGVMAETGLSYDELTQQLINQQPRDPRTEATISRLEAKVRELEQQVEGTRKTYSDNQKQAYDAAVKQIEVDVRNLVKTNPEFETIKATGSVRDVVELIEETYRKDGVLMSVEDAAQEVETYLMEEAYKLSRLNKIQKRLQENASKSQAQAPVQKKTAEAPKQQQPMKTLTNASGSSRTLSARERAILAFKGEKF